MNETTKLIEYIKHRIDLIQNKRCFDPSLGAKQAEGNPELAKDYARFDELCKIAKVLDIPITFSGKLIISKKPQRIYFQRQYENGLQKKKVKVGRSVDPHARKKTFKTGNSATLVVERDILIPTDLLVVEIEGILKQYLSKHRDANEGSSKEWFYLTVEETKEIKHLIDNSDIEGLKSFLKELR